MTGGRAAQDRQKGTNPAETATCAPCRIPAHEAAGSDGVFPRKSAWERRPPRVADGTRLGTVAVRYGPEILSHSTR